MKEGMIKLVNERARFMEAQTEYKIDKAYFSRMGDHGRRSWWVVSVYPNGRAVSCFFKLQAGKYRSQPDEVTKALLLKAWPVWIPDVKWD